MSDVQADASAALAQLRVRTMGVDDLDVRIRYFREAADEQS